VISVSVPGWRQFQGRAAVEFMNAAGMTPQRRVRGTSPRAENFEVLRMAAKFPILTDPF